MLSNPSLPYDLWDGVPITHLLIMAWVNAHLAYCLWCKTRRRHACESQSSRRLVCSSRVTSVKCHTMECIKTEIDPASPLIQRRGHVALNPGMVLNFIIINPGDLLNAINWKWPKERIAAKRQCLIWLSRGQQGGGWRSWDGLVCDLCRFVCWPGVGSGGDIFLMIFRGPF